MRDNTGGLTLLYNLGSVMLIGILLGIILS